MLSEKIPKKKKKKVVQESGKELVSYSPSDTARKFSAREKYENF